MCEVSVIPSLWPPLPPAVKEAGIRSIKGKEDKIIPSKQNNVTVLGTKVITTSGKGKNSEPQFFNQLAETIENIRERPILVFMTEEYSKRFYEFCLHLCDKKVFLLKERGSGTETENCIEMAGERRRVTIVDRAFGRGIDFKSYSKDVAEMGGVHVIQTFVSRSEVEEHQIQGRTGRQGNPGTYQKILWLSDLDDELISCWDVEIDWFNHSDPEGEESAQDWCANFLSNRSFASWDEFIRRELEDQVSIKLDEMEKRWNLQWHIGI